MYRWEGAGITLLVGTIPLIVANLLAFIFVWKEKIKFPARLLFFLPGIICISLATSYLLYDGSASASDRNTFRHKMGYDLNDFYRHNDSYEAIFRLYRNTSANSFLFEVTDDNLGIEELTAAGKNHFHYVVIDLCEEELFPGTDKKYQTMVYDVESGNFWLGKDCAHLYSYGKCAVENYRVDTDLLAYVEGKWEVPEYQTFYDYLCSMDWLKTS